jgi:hypothetical protein
MKKSGIPALTEWRKNAGKGGTLVQIQLIYGSGEFSLNLQFKISNDQLDVRLRRSFSFF